MKNTTDPKDRTRQVVIQFSNNPERFAGPFDKYVVVESVLLNQYGSTKEKPRNK